MRHDEKLKTVKKIKEFYIGIEGINPMLINKLSKELIDEQKNIPKAQREDWEEKNWKKKLHGSEDKIVFPGEVILSFLKECAVKYTAVEKAPRGMGSWTNYISGNCCVTNVQPLDYTKIEPLGKMVNGNPSAKGKSSKVYKIRPRIDGWKLRFSFTDMSGFLKGEVVGRMLNNGGLMVGFGDWRPVYGRFKLISLSEKEIEL